MPRTRGTLVESNISKGLITEVSALSFPEGAAFDLDNVVINKDGSVQRREGMTFEKPSNPNYTRDDSAISEFVWDNVAGSGDRIFTVLQVGDILHFFLVPTSGSLTDNRLDFTYTLDPVDVSITDAGSSPCQYASGDGKLYVFHPLCDPVVIEYDPVGEDIDATVLILRIRDFEGVEDSLDDDERPAALTDAHEYNLYNQGWYIDNVLTDTAGNVTEPPVTVFESQVSAYPSNCDVWWTFKKADTTFVPAETAFSLATGNTPAPKGHFILNPFDTDRSGADADLGTVDETSSGFKRPKTGCFFAGRVWYSGVNNKEFTNKVYFSQIAERDGQVRFCYQKNDPTSETLFDLLADDGGVVTVKEAGNVIKLIAMGDSVLIMATNGIWSISGSEGIGFKATDYSVRKISGVGVQNPDCIVVADGTPFFWNPDGIWVIQSQPGGGLEITSITEKSIKSFYDDIPPLSKNYAKGAFDSINKIIQWVYRSVNNEGFDQRYNYDRVLCFNATLGCFYTYNLPRFVTVDTDVPGPDERSEQINGIIATSNPLSLNNDRVFYYFTTRWHDGDTTYKGGWSQEADGSYTDWGQTFDSFFVTGYKLLGQGNKDFQSNYVTTFLDNQDDDSSLLVRGLWDFTQTDETRFSSPQQCYQWSDGFSTAVRRLKIRGHGKALQLRFYSEEGLPFYWLGWACEVTGNATP